MGIGPKKETVGCGWMDAGVELQKGLKVVRRGTVGGEGRGGGGMDGEGRYFQRATLLEWQLVAMEISPKHLRAPGFDGTGGAGRWGSEPRQPIGAVQTPLTHFPHAESQHLQGYTTVSPLPPLSVAPKMKKKNKGRKWTDVKMSTGLIGTNAEAYLSTEPCFEKKRTIQWRYIINCVMVTDLVILGTQSAGMLCVLSHINTTSRKKNLLVALAKHVAPPEAH